MLDPTVFLFPIIVILVVAVAVQSVFVTRLKREHQAKMRRVLHLLMSVIRAAEKEMARRVRIAEDHDFRSGSPEYRRKLGLRIGPFIWSPGDPIPADVPESIADLLRSLGNPPRNWSSEIADWSRLGDAPSLDEILRAVKDGKAKLVTEGVGSDDLLYDEHGPAAPGPAKDTTTINEAAHRSYLHRWF